MRATGKWEENADGVLFLYRDAYYNPDTEFSNVAEIIIAKNRGGKTGAASVYAKMDTAEFIDLEVRIKPLEY
jgi:replicative DNA helicase